MVISTSDELRFRARGLNRALFNPPTLRHRPSDEWYTEEDRRFVAELCRRNLKYTFGYRY